jgi:hypothetical protein
MPRSAIGFAIHYPRIVSAMCWTGGRSLIS